MELIALLQALWRHRILVVVGLILAVAVGLKVGGENAPTGVASARVLLDTPDSQLLNSDSPGAETLGWRASMLAELVSSREATTQIARELHIRPDRVVVMSRALNVAPKPSPLSDLGLEAAAGTQAPYVLTIGSTPDAWGGPQLPIISIGARAPSVMKASRLAAAAVAALKTAASAPAGRTVQQVVLEPVGPVRAVEVPARSRRMMAVAAAAFLFGLWCLCVAAGSGLLRTRRGFRRAQLAA